MCGGSEASRAFKGGGGGEAIWSVYLVPQMQNYLLLFCLQHAPTRVIPLFSNASLFSYILLLSLSLSFSTAAVFLTRY